MMALFSSSAGFTSYLGVLCPATLQDTHTQFALRLPSDHMYMHIATINMKYSKYFKLEVRFGSKPLLLALQPSTSTGVSVAWKSKRGLPPKSL